MSLETKRRAVFITLPGRAAHWSECSFGTVSSFKIWGGIIMYYGADIHMRPGPQRGMLVIGTRVCTKSIKFLRFEKNEGEKKSLIFFHTFHLRCSASQRRTKYSSLLSCEVYWGDFCGWLLTPAFGSFLCQMGISAGTICLSITSTSQCSLHVQITVPLRVCVCANEQAYCIYYVCVHVCMHVRHFTS